MSIFQPSNQIRLTNVSVVRLRKGGKRFELACYKNKVMEWRSGVETDLDNVLQVHTVFVNVSKGQVASHDEVVNAFNTDDTNAVVLEILKKGELQASTLERNSQLQTLHRDIVQMITDMTVNPQTKRPYPSTIIEKVMNDMHVNLNATKSAKQQALEIVKQMQSNDAKRIKEKLHACYSSTEHEDWAATEYSAEVTIDPGQFRVLTALVQEESKGKGRVDLVTLKESVAGEERF